MVRNLCASDIMHPDVVTLKPGDNLSNAATVLRENEISGAPVIDDDGRVVGVISQSDLLRELVQIEVEDYLTNSYYMCLPYSDGSVFVNASAQPEKVPVSQLMTKSVITVSPDDTVPAVASILRGNKIHRVLVVKDEKLVGIVSSFDILAAIEAH